MKFKDLIEVQGFDELLFEYLQVKLTLQVSQEKWIQIEIITIENIRSQRMASFKDAPNNWFQVWKDLKSKDKAHSSTIVCSVFLQLHCT